MVAGSFQLLSWSKEGKTGEKENPSEEGVQSSLVADGSDLGRVVMYETAVF